MIFNILVILFWSIANIISFPILLIPMLIGKLKMVNKFCIFLAKGTLFLLKICEGITYEVRGLDNIPTNQQFIVACQHQSAFETFIMMSFFKNPLFILKRELIWVFPVSLYFWITKNIFIKRNGNMKSLRDMINKAKARVAENRTLIIFPQGTRQSIKHKITLKVGIFLLYQKINVQVLPIAINTGLFWPKNMLSLNRKPGKAIIEILPPILPGLDKEEFMGKLQRDIEIKAQELVAESL